MLLIYLPVERCDLIQTSSVNSTRSNFMCTNLTSELVHCVLPTRNGGKWRNTYLGIWL